MKFLGYGVIHKETRQSKGLWPMTIEVASELARAAGVGNPPGQWLLVPLHGTEPFELVMDDTPVHLVVKVVNDPNGPVVQIEVDDLV